MNPKRLMRFAAILILPWIGPLWIYLRHERDNVLAVVLWPFVYCVFGLSQIPRAGTRWYSAIIALALLCLALFEAYVSALVQASDAPASEWPFAIAVFYLPYVLLSFWGDFILYKTRANPSNGHPPSPLGCPS